MLRPPPSLLQPLFAIAQSPVSMSNQNFESCIVELQELIESKAKEIVELLRIVQTQTGEAKREAGWKLFYCTVRFSIYSITTQ